MNKPLLATGAVILGLLLTACGSSSPSSSGNSAKSTSAQSTETADAGNALTLAANPQGQLKYDETALSARSGRVMIKFTNSSPVGHDVVIQSGTDGTQQGATPVFSGGTKTLAVSLKPGKYTFYCSVPGHREAGMVGTLTVH